MPGTTYSNLVHLFPRVCARSWDSACRFVSLPSNQICKPKGPSWPDAATDMSPTREQRISNFIVRKCNAHLQ